MIAALILQAAASGWSPLTLDDVLHDRIADVDKPIVSDLRKITERTCGPRQETDCWVQGLADAANVVNKTHAWGAAHSTFLQNALRRHCEEAGLIGKFTFTGPIAQCYIDASKAPFGSEYKAAGVPVAGVTQLGFAMVGTSMEKMDVDHVLGSDGELSSEVAEGGTTIETYTWRSPRGGVLAVTLKNGFVVGKAQVGLR